MLLEEQFLKVASKYPDKIAIASGNKNISYSELEDLVLRCRDNIICKISDKRIGLIADQNEDAIICLIATIFAGKTIVPIDPRLGADDVSAILRELTSVVLVDDKFQENSSELTFYRFSDLLKKSKAALDGRDATYGGHDSSAYILHTSGTTGRPKPVLANASSLQWVSNELARRYHTNKDSNVIQFAYLSFDSAFVEIWSTLLMGGTLIIPGGKIRENLYGTFGDIAKDYSNIMLTLPPSVAENLDDNVLSSIKTLILAGEELPRMLANNLLGKVKYLINAYGPTESIICATTYEIRKQITGRVPIGRPLDGMKIVLDPQTKEMLLYSDYLAEGYIGRDDKESFLSDKAGRYYRTGDIAILDDQGDYTFIGRTDRQIKLNGQRIELEGLESRLRSGTNNSRVYLVDLDTDSNTINLHCLYINKEPYSIALLNSFLPKSIALASTLKIDKVPLNRNGKVDYEKLKDLLNESSEHNGFGKIDSKYKPMIQIWRCVFGADMAIAEDTAFFDIGGDSLAALKLVSLINDRYSVELNLIDIINNDTPEMLVELLEKRL
jgi:non-ribosomal peptide synthetase component F/acyl carrier protein